MLGQGCFRAFVGEQVTSSSSGLKMSISWIGSKSGSKVSWVQQWVKMRQNPLLPITMESQTSVSKRAPREFRKWRVQGNLLTLRQPFGIVQKVFSEKASATARMRQKCVKNLMRQRGSCFIGKRETFQNASEMRQNCGPSFRGLQAPV